MIKLNDSTFISGSNDGTIRQWKISPGTVGMVWSVNFYAMVYGLANLNNGLIAVGIWGKPVNNLMLMNTNTWTVESYLLGHTNSVYSIALLSDGRL